MTDVYQCSACGMILMGRGLSLHMKKVHGLKRDDYDKSKESNNDLIILWDNIPRGDAGLSWKKGYVIAKWLFEVGGKYKTIFKKGNMKAYRLWVSGRIRYVNNKYKASLREPKYIDDDWR